MLGWLLRGRAHLNPAEFRNRNHKQVFINAFVILDLLQPLVFEDSQVGEGAPAVYVTLFFRQGFFGEGGIHTPLKMFRPHLEISNPDPPKWYTAAHYPIPPPPPPPLPARSYTSTYMYIILDSYPSTIAVSGKVSHTEAVLCNRFTKTEHRESLGGGGGGGGGVPNLCSIHRTRST